MQGVTKVVRQERQVVRQVRPLINIQSANQLAQASMDVLQEGRTKGPLASDLRLKLKLRSLVPIYNSMEGLIDCDLLLEAKITCSFCFSIFI